jgi:hypothetical protein
MAKSVPLAPFHSSHLSSSPRSWSSPEVIDIHRTTMYKASMYGLE